VTVGANNGFINVPVGSTLFFNSSLTSQGGGNLSFYGGGSVVGNTNNPHIIFGLSNNVAQISVEYKYLEQMDVTTLALETGNSFGELTNGGLVGANIPPATNTVWPFNAEEQRGALNAMGAAIGAWGRGGTIVSDSTCDECVAAGMASIQAAFDLQMPSGDFYNYLTLNANGTLTGSGSGGGNFTDMRFFLAWGTHALLLMQNNPHYLCRYQPQIIALLPKLQKALDFYCAHGFASGSYSDQWVPNRDLSDACAPGLGNLLLSQYLNQTNWNHSGYNNGTYITKPTYGWTIIFCIPIMKPTTDHLWIQIPGSIMRGERYQMGAAMIIAIKVLG